MRTNSKVNTNSSVPSDYIRTEDPMGPVFGVASNFSNNDRVYAKEKHNPHGYQSNYNSDSLLFLNENFKKYVKIDYARKFNLVFDGKYWNVGRYRIPSDPKVIQIPCPPGEHYPPWRLIWRFGVKNKETQQSISLRLTVLGNGTAVVEQVADKKLVKRVEVIKLV